MSKTLEDVKVKRKWPECEPKVNRVINKFLHDSTRFHGVDIWSGSWNMGRTWATADEVKIF